MAVHKFGPDGNFVYGGPINRLDRGGSGFIVSKAIRRGIMKFGTVVNWLAISPDEAQQLATAMRSQCIKAFGNLSYNKSQLPIRVIANRDKGVVELYLPAMVETMVAHPEMWLALAEVLDTTVASMKTPDDQ